MNAARAFKSNCNDRCSVNEAGVPSFIPSVWAIAAYSILFGITFVCAGPASAESCHSGGLTLHGGFAGPLREAIEYPGNIRSWHLADMDDPLTNVRFRG